MNREHALETHKVKFSYGPRAALTDIDLTVPRGEIFGLIGPDGAGKSTLFNILGGLLEPEAGEISFFGQPVRAAHRQIGYVTQVFSLYQDLGIAENINYFGRLRGLKEDEIVVGSRRYLEMFDLARFVDRQAGHLSGGMKQKLALICALIARPQLLLLDEPTTGIDPISRRELWDLLGGLCAEGITILAATPYLDEAERCHRIALMQDGKILATGAPAQLKRDLSLIRLEITVTDLARAMERLTAHSEFLEVQRLGDRIDLLTDNSYGEQRVHEILAELVINVRRSLPTMEDLFALSLRAAGHQQQAICLPYISPATRTDDIAIEARNITKRFGDFTAVKSVALTVRHGEIYGLLGTNGAGKTTLLKMLVGLIPATSGRLALLGTETRMLSLRQQIGYMSQKFSLYNDLTIAENLELFAGLYGLPRAHRELKIGWALEFSGLTGRSHELTASLPSGWKQRLAFAAALMHEPKILFLDEPTSGTDPLARRAMWQIINACADRGMAIVVTTHYLDEAEQCNRIGFMLAGELIAEGPPGRLTEAYALSLEDLFLAMARARQTGEEHQWTR